MFKFFKKSGPKEILFGKDETWMEYPDSASSHVPKWYKEMPRLRWGDEPIIHGEGQETNLGVKYCAPFLDALTLGYTALLPQDLKITRGPEGVNFAWQIESPLVDGRNGIGFEKLPVPAGHGGKQYVWVQPYSVKVPRGYSVLYTHPLNRHDLPFTTLSGVHDSDTLMPPGNFPFYLREDFEGIIPKDTPIFQIIPFKRDDWVGRGVEELAKKGADRAIVSGTMITGYYKKKLWTRKNYRMEKEED